MIERHGWMPAARSMTFGLGQRLERGHRPLESASCRLNEVYKYDLLAPVYAWFTEGFDTADWQEAKELWAALT